MNKLKFGCLLVATLAAIFLLCACSAKNSNSTAASSGSDTISASSTAEVRAHQDYPFPDGCELQEEDLQKVMEAYAEYMTTSLSGSGIEVALRIEDDGSIHFDGKKGEDELPDLKVYTNLRTAYSYLYAVGQVDLEGNLLVVASEVTDEMEKAEQDAQSDSALGAPETAFEASERINEGRHTPQD